MQNTYQKQFSANKIWFEFVFIAENNALCPFTKPHTYKSVKNIDKKSTPQGAFPEHPFLKQGNTLGYCDSIRSLATKYLRA
jgi:hypothetical protein